MPACAVVALLAVSAKRGRGQSRREALRLTGLALATVPRRAARAADGFKLSRAEVEAKLKGVPVCAIVNAEGAPFFTDGGRVGYFYFDPSDALKDLKDLRKDSPDARLQVVTLPEVYFPFVKGEQASLGGSLRLRPPRRQVVIANRNLQASASANVMMPTMLDETKGQVPLFYSERVAFEDKQGQPTFPFFFAQEALETAYAAATGAISTSDFLQGASAPADAKGIPADILKVTTLDLLLSQMENGDVDLTRAVLVPSRDAAIALGELAKNPP